MKTLVLNVGNTSLFGGVFAAGKLQSQFRAPVRAATTARGFARIVSARGGFECVAIGSVVPALTPKMARLVRRRFGVVPRVLTFDAPHGLKIGYRRPRELGTDRLAAALGARKIFPRRHAIVVDCGTATTVTALDRNGTLRGGAILPGLALWPAMLAARTAQLPEIKLRRPRAALGRATEENLQSGIFYGHAGAIRALIQKIGAEAFGRSAAAAVVIGTGGHAEIFSAEKIFDRIVPELVLVGLDVFAREGL